jgi:hypothetical protein
MRLSDLLPPRRPGSELSDRLREEILSLAHATDVERLAARLPRGALPREDSQ